jgi:hypothetical protein
MKCWNSAFNARGSKLITVIVQLGAVKIYVAAAVAAFRKKERQDETQFTTKIDGFLSFIPRWMLMHFFGVFFFWNLNLCMTKLRVLVLCFSCFTDNSITSKPLPGRHWYEVRISCWSYQCGCWFTLALIVLSKNLGGILGGTQCEMGDCLVLSECSLNVKSSW